MHATTHPAMRAHRARMAAQHAADMRQQAALRAAAIYAAPRPYVDTHGRRRDAKTGRFLPVR